MICVDQSREGLTGEKSVFEELSGGFDTLALGAQEVNSRAYCSWFGFSGQAQQKQLSKLSGGERNRVQLAKVPRPRRYLPCRHARCRDSACRYLPCGYLLCSSSPCQGAQVGWQRAAARRADQRPRREHHALARGGSLLDSYAEHPEPDSSPLTLATHPDPALAPTQSLRGTV